MNFFLFASVGFGLTGFMFHREFGFKPRSFLANGRRDLSQLDPAFLMLILRVMILQSRVRTVQRESLHGSLLSDFTLGAVGCVLEGVADFTKVKGSEVAVTLVVPFWSASSVTRDNELIQLCINLLISKYYK